MKLFASAALTALVLFSGPSFAEQTLNATQQTSRDATFLPTANGQSPHDFNHMGAGSDKSDELGVPYYNQRA
ncbi:MAG: multiple antibiotic resistance protein MarB [Leclercia sp.]